VFADGYVPREVEFAVVEQHPTLLNVTLHPAKVGQRPRKQQRPAETPPWLGGSSAGMVGMLVTRGPHIVGNRGDIGDTNQPGGGTNNPLLTPHLLTPASSSPQSNGGAELEPYTFFNPGTYVPVTFAPRPFDRHYYSTAAAATRPLWPLLAAALFAFLC
jgi:hypothetical protein